MGAHSSFDQVGGGRSSPAPVLQERGRVPLPPLGPEHTAFDAAQGQQDMGMWLRLAVAALYPMDGDIGDHAAGDAFPPDKILREPDGRNFTRLSASNRPALMVKSG